MMAGKVTRTTSRLADGRELLYFDDEPGANRSQSDRRDIAAARTTSEIRYDVLVDQWVVIAGHRQTRTHLPPTTQCPLCPSTPDRLTEVPAGDYDVVVFENRFPSLSHGLEPRLGGLLQTLPPTGCSCGGQDLAAARWCVSPPTTTRRSRTCHRAALPPCSRPGPTGPGRCSPCRASSRCSFGDAPEPTAGQTLPR
jgi:hypothetical protein